MEVDGQAVAEERPRDRPRTWIAAIYQQPALFADLTIAENTRWG